jgi:ABC-type proline/glycine betaine transport system ATPase subunit
MAALMASAEGERTLYDNMIELQAFHLKSASALSSKECFCFCPKERMFVTPKNSLVTALSSRQ